MTDLFNQPLPHNKEAEDALIGSLLVDPTAISKIQMVIKGGDLFDPANQDIYGAILELYERGDPVDVISVSEQLTSMGKMNDQEAWLKVSTLTMSSRLPSALNANYYAKVVSDYGAKRRIMWVAEQMAKAVYENISVDAIRHKVDKWMVQATPHNHAAIVDFTVALEGTFTKLLQIREGTADFFLPCSLHDVENRVEGFARGEVTVIGAFTGGGKTALGLQEFRDKAKRGYRGVYVSTEVYAHVISDRNLSSEAQVNYGQVRRGYRKGDDDLPYSAPDWDTFMYRLAQPKERLAALPMHILAPVWDFNTRRVSRPDMTPRGIRAAIRNFSERQPIDFIVVDYLTNLNLPMGKGGGDRSLIVEDALRVIRDTAIEVGAAAIVLAQFNREANRSKEPKLHHLEQSTGIEKGADNVWLMYPPDEKKEYELVIDVAKGRNIGSSVISGVYFDGAIQYFTDDYIRSVSANYSTPLLPSQKGYTNAKMHEEDEPPIPPYEYTEFHKDDYDNFDF